ncbi:hypothetical protein I4U23_010363 [Adineta vaga]|nr:hypothetical protein I4U23_010363 [Adineta vaga]
MDDNPLLPKAEPVTPTLIDLLKKYTTRVDERETLWKEGTRACRQEQNTQNDEIQRLKDSVQRLQSNSTVIQTPSTIDYKAKWEESEAKYHQLENKYQQLENKIDQLQHDANHMKLIKERILEICSCHKLTHQQIEQLKLLVNNNISIESIANKNDFHQQTLKIRDILVKHNDELFNRLEDMINKKRKRNIYEDSEYTFILDQAKMESKSTYSPFVEHSFRRLTLLIHQQDRLHTSPSKSTEQTSNSASRSRENKICNDELVSVPSKSKSHSQSTHTNDTKFKVEPISRMPRTYMRPPKHRTIVSHRCSSSQVFDRSETSFNQSFESPCSPSVTKQESNELPVHKPHERSQYDIQFERDRQNDIREKYNIPAPFERTWLRQPRYVPQERPNFGEKHQSQSQ